MRETKYEYNDIKNMDSWEVIAESLRIFNDIKNLTPDTDKEIRNILFVKLGDTFDRITDLDCWDLHDIYQDLQKETLGA